MPSREVRGSSNARRYGGVILLVLNNAFNSMPVALATENSERLLPWQKATLQYGRGHWELQLSSNSFIKQVNSPVLFIANSSDYNRIGLLSSNNLFIISIQEHQQDSRLIPKCISKFAEILPPGKTILWINYEVKPPFKDIAPYFEYMWANKILNVVAMFDSGCASNQIFTYNPFPTLKAENISSEKDVFPDKLGDLRGFPIKTVLKSDEPRIFRYKDYSGRMKMGGYVSKIFLTFLEKHNATLQEYPMPNASFVNPIFIGHLVYAGNITISIHPYVQSGLPIDGSYPIGFINECIMVPGPTDIWMLLLLTALLTLTQHLYLNKFIAGKFHLGLALLDTVSGLASQPFGGSPRSNTWTRKCIRLFVVIFGVFIASIYESRLASVFVTKLFEPPLETKEDMIRAKLRIFMIEHEFEFIRDSIQPQEFQDLIIPAEAPVVMAYRASFNSSYGYAAPDDKALYFILQQKHLKRRLILFSKVCLVTMHLGFYMQINSPFKDIFNRVLLQSFQSGLYYKWREDVFNEAVEAEILPRRTDPENVSLPIKVLHLNFAWMTLFYGLFCSLPGFFIEIISKGHLLKAFDTFR